MANHSIGGSIPRECAGDEKCTSRGCKDNLSHNITLRLTTARAKTERLIFAKFGS
jgi:hypothetical protein